MDEAVVTLHRILGRLRDLLPEVELGVDERGQFVLYTGLFLRDREPPADGPPQPEEAPS